MPRVLACITTRDGNPPTLVREKVEAALRHLAASGTGGHVKAVDIANFVGEEDPADVPEPAGVA